MRLSCAAAGPLLLDGDRAHARARLALTPVKEKVDSEKDRENEQDAHPKIEAH